MKSLEKINTRLVALLDGFDPKLTLGAKNPMLWEETKEMEVSSTILHNVASLLDGKEKVARVYHNLAKNVEIARANFDEEVIRA